MQAPFELIEGRKHLQDIIDAFPPDSPHWNEAQNRFHFVDRLLKECLGWEHPYIDVECSDDAGGRSDYILGQQPKLAILEAKREARIFDALPVGKPTIVRKLEPLLKSCKVFEEAVSQVIKYCALHGAHIAIVCNGPQLAIFQSIGTGQSPLKGECYFFNGYQTYIEDFSLLWRLLSPEGISENRAYRELALNRNPRIPAKASSAIPEPTRYRYRNSFQENLRTIASVLLEDIEDHPSVKTEFYKDCYVDIEANSRHLLLSKNIIAERYRRVSDNGISPAQLNSSNAEVESGKLKVESGIFSAVLGVRPFIVVGDVGVGKTSFFENLYEKLDAQEKKNTYFIHINLGSEATLAMDLKSYVLDAIPIILREKYNIDIENGEFVNAVYFSGLRDFDNSIKGKLKAIDEKSYQREKVEFLAEKVKRKDAHLHAALGHLAQGRQKQIILVIDNADQRKFETQQEAFLIAQELAASRNLLVFVALRPSTFYQSKLSGALSGYQSRVLSIAPPPADKVLEKRILFAVRVAEGKIAPAALSGIRLHLNSIVLFLNVLLRSIKSNPDIRIFLSNITGGIHDL